MKKADKIVVKAQALASSVGTWADLSNALFDPMNGLLATNYPTRAEREKFMKTEQYKQIKKLLRKAIDRFGLVEGGAPQKSGRFVVRLPKSLHVALDLEAKTEGVSLNQLVVAKLASRLGALAAK